MPAGVARPPLIGNASGVINPTEAAPGMGGRILHRGGALQRQAGVQPRSSLPMGFVPSFPVR